MSEPDAVMAQAVQNLRIRWVVRQQVRTAERDALQQALNANMSKCRGIPDSRCNYSAHCYGPCNKCGRQHDAARTGSKP